MASRRAIVGIVLLVIGALLFAVAAFLPQTGSATVPAGAGWQLTPTAIGSESLSLSWSGGTSGTNVTLYDCGSACPSTASGLASLSTVAKGYGASGTVSTTVTSGHVYMFVETAGTSSLSASYSAMGLTILGVIGIVIAVVGTVLVLLPSRSPPPEEAPAEEAPAEA